MRAMKGEKSFALDLSRGASKALDKLGTRTAKKVIEALREVQKDPIRPRSKADIIKIRGRKEPPAYRLKGSSLISMGSQVSLYTNSY